MTKLKISLWLILLILVGTPVGYIGYLNQSYFMQTSSLTFLVETPININYNSPEITNAVYWLGCIIVTWLVISILRLPKYFRIRKKINLLEEQVSNQKIDIAQLLDSQNSTSSEQPTKSSSTGDTEEVEEVTAVETIAKSAL